MRMARMFARAGAVGLLCLASCSDPAEPAGQGVVSVHVAQMAGTTCTPGPHWANVPFSPTAGQRVTASTVSEAGKRAVDGEEGMNVRCRVAPENGKFKVHAELTSPAVVNMANLTVTTIILDTTIGAGEEGAVGSLSLLDDKTESRFDSSNCKYSVKANGDNLAVDAGKIWGSLTCTSLADPGDMGAACTVDRGFFVLENCSQ